MPSNPNTRRTWAEISVTALQHNYATIRDFVTPAAVCAVVKANAYGHGGAECARALQKEGAKWFAVTDATEAIELRKAGVTGRILLLSGFSRGEEESIIEHNLTPVIWDWSHVELLEDAAEKMDKAPQSVPVHLKIDTGMARLGVDIADLPNMVQVLQSANFVMLEGVLSHLASAEVIDAPDVEAQLVRFDDAVTAVLESGLSPIYYHICNSAAIVSRERAWKNMVRPGISLYGYYLPFMSVITGSPDASRELPIIPVLSWKTRIIAVRDVGARQPLGYNGGYVTQAPARIAVLPVGYGDGLNRHLSNRGRVIVRNDYASIVGNVSMDITLVDVTGMHGVDVGDEVILIGATETRKISAWEHAGHAQTIPYEILCAITARVPRVSVE
ncbi:MAG: alanine racemase [Acidobacteriales bacterium]|nr:alanine racemase [Terriglobales bacterium]